MPTLAKVFSKVSGWNDVIKGVDDLDKYTEKIIESHKKVFNPKNVPQNLVESYLQKISATTTKESAFFGETGNVNMRAVIVDFFGAGTNTVSESLTWLLTVLIYNPEKQNKLQKEIDNVVGRNRLPTLADRPSLPYVEAFIFEIHRFSSLVPLGFAHETSADVKLEEYMIPKGTVVIANVYEAFNDPKRWDEPEKFKPERFLNNDGTAVERNIARTVDIVFGHGKRSCPGEALAKDELFLFTAGLCQRYTFKRDPKFDYGQQIQTQLGIALIPKPHTLLIHKR